MNLLDLINAYRASQPAPQAPAAPMPGASFLSGLMTGSGAGAPPGFSLPYANAISVPGNQFYPGYQFGNVANPASERLGIVPQGGLLPGMAMQLAAANNPYIPTPVTDPRQPRGGGGGGRGNYMTPAQRMQWEMSLWRDGMGGRDPRGGMGGGSDPGGYRERARELGPADGRNTFDGRGGPMGGYA